VDDVETPDGNIIWAVEGAINLSITISDQEARISSVDEGWSGTEIIVFTATDDDPEGSLSNSDEVTFTINAATTLERSDFETIILYPNPSKGEFIIDTYGEPKDLILVIYDCQGRVLKHQKYENVSRLRNDLYAYPSGIYHIEVITDKRIQQIKYLKQ